MNKIIYHWTIRHCSKNNADCVGKLLRFSKRLPVSHAHFKKEALREGRRHNYRKPSLLRPCAHALVNICSNSSTAGDVSIFSKNFSNGKLNNIQTKLFLCRIESYDHDKHSYNIHLHWNMDSHLFLWLKSQLYMYNPMRY